MKVLELFCGTKSFSKEAEALGHQVFTIDIDPRFNPDICINILDLKAEDILNKFGQPDVIWASPPCTTFSVASIGTHWTGGKGAYIPKTNEANIGIALLEKTLDLIDELNPKFWIIENPRGIMRKMKIMELNNKFRQTVTYCQYGDTRMKPTDIWTNIKWIGKRCHNRDTCHIAAPRGSKTGTQGLKNSKERSIVPALLCKEILKSIDNPKQQEVLK